MQDSPIHPAGAPLALHTESVAPEWIDYNGHMNVAYYVLIFDHASDALIDHLELGAEYRRRTDCTFMVAEAHVTYDREVGEGDALSVTTQILDFDSKRLHLFHRMFADGSEEPVATNEVMVLHIDGVARRVSELPATALERIAPIAAGHAGLARPPQAGRAIGVRRKHQD